MENWYVNTQAGSVTSRYELLLFSMAIMHHEPIRVEYFLNTVNNGMPSPEDPEPQQLQQQPEQQQQQQQQQLMWMPQSELSLPGFEEKAKDINSPDSNDSGIQADVHVQHHHGPLNEDIYAVVDKKSKKSKDKQHGQDATSADKESSQDRLQEDGDLAEVLPPGWEKHQDEDGPYYWHIKSGTIQRDPPPPPPPDRNYGKPLSPKQTQDSASPAVSSPPEKDNAPKDKERHNAFNKGKDEGEASSEEFPIRFAVRSLGWVRIAEEDLTPEKSSKAVNKCIVDLSLGRNDINDVVGRWGDGKDLYMDLDEENLSLIDPQDVTILNLQPIQSIRVWGVGRDNGRDFAYVARDRTSRKHMCHVFRCDTPARQIANTLRDICQKIMLERSLQQAGAGAPGVGSGGGRAGGINRPNNLPNLERFDQMDGQKITFESLFNNTSFPTPMEEPKKVIRCHYLGTLQVVKSTGERNLSVDILNNAMEKMYHRVPPEKWTFVSVAIAPSTITITEHAKPDNILAECRVRFLAFMGIAMKNVKLCSFIMHTAQDQFVAHVFHCEPSAGALCKTIEAACKLRYQKCLDAHAKQNPSLGKDGQHQSKPVEPSAPPVPPVSVAAAAADASQPGLASKLSTTLKSTVHNSNAKLTTLKSSVQHAVQFVKKKASANKS